MLSASRMPLARGQSPRDYSVRFRAINSSLPAFFSSKIVAWSHACARACVSLCVCVRARCRWNAYHHPDDESGPRGAVCNGSLYLGKTRSRADRIRYVIYLYNEARLLRSVFVSLARHRARHVDLPRAFRIVARMYIYLELGNHVVFWALDFSRWRCSCLRVVWCVRHSGWVFPLARGISHGWGIFSGGWRLSRIFWTLRLFWKFVFVELLATGAFVAGKRQVAKYIYDIYHLL